jgi:hypothetical protein
MRYVIIGQKGDQQLLVVDTQLMTVTPLDSSAVLTEEMQSMLADGGALHDGIDVAIAADTRDDGNAIWYFQGK